MAAATKPRELLLSQLLTLHLDLSIKRYEVQSGMSKFLQLADDIESDLKELDEEANLLNAKRLKNKERARQIFNDHNAAQDRVAEGMKRMDQVLHDMGGSNSRKASEDEKAEAVKPPVPETPKLGEDSAASSEASFQTTDGNSGTKVG